MPKLTKKQQKELNDIFDNLSAAIDYLEREDIALCHKEQGTPRGQVDFSRRYDDTILSEMSKFVGSPLFRLLTAKDRLGQFIFTAS